MQPGSTQPPSSQPPPSQPYPPPYPPPYPQAYAAPPPVRGWSTGKILAVVIAVVVVLVIVAIVVPPILNAANKAANPPNIQLTDTSAAWTAGCFFLDPPHQVTYSFTLVNTGGSAGFATVGFYIDGTVVDTSRYYVSAGQSLPETRVVSINDCSDHTWGIEIQSVTT